MKMDQGCPRRLQLGENLKFKSLCAADVVVNFASPVTSPLEELQSFWFRIQHRSIFSQERLFTSLGSGTQLSTNALPCFCSSWAGRKHGCKEIVDKELAFSCIVPLEE